MPYLIFLKNQQICNCRLLQIIGGALRVNSWGGRVNYLFNSACFASSLSSAVFFFFFFFLGGGGGGGRGSSLSYPLFSTLVLVQPRKISPDMTEKLLTGM